MNRHQQIVKALKDIAPDAEYTLSGDDLENLVWHGKSAKPTTEEIEKAIANPLPEIEPTVEEKLAAAGVNLQQLKEALGLV